MNSRYFLCNAVAYLRLKSLGNFAPAELTFGPDFFKNGECFLMGKIHNHVLNEPLNSRIIKRGFLFDGVPKYLGGTGQFLV